MEPPGAVSSGFSSSVPVSYTHLDVYKRQRMLFRLEPGSWLQHRKGLCRDAVSYTHLTAVTVLHQETNEAKPGYREQMEVGPHKQHCPSAAFEDLALDAWYHEATDFVIARGYMKGISATRFAPGSSLTRAQAVTILYRMEGEPETGTELSFVDVPKDQYYTQAVIWAAEHQIVKGMDGTHYAPNGMITREQMVTMLARYAAYKGVDVRAKTEPDFPDVERVSPCLLYTSAADS